MVLKLPRSAPYADILRHSSKLKLKTTKIKALKRSKLKMNSGPVLTDGALFLLRARCNYGRLIKGGGIYGEG